MGAERAGWVEGAERAGWVEGAERAVDRRRRHRARIRGGRVGSCCGARPHPSRKPEAGPQQNGSCGGEWWRWGGGGGGRRRLGMAAVAGMAWGGPTLVAVAGDGRWRWWQGMGGDACGGYCWPLGARGRRAARAGCRACGACGACLLRRVRGVLAAGRAGRAGRVRDARRTARVRRQLARRTVTAPSACRLTRPRSRAHPHASWSPPRQSGGVERERGRVTGQPAKPVPAFHSASSPPVHRTRPAQCPISAGSAGPARLAAPAEEPERRRGVGSRRFAARTSEPLRSRGACTLSRARRL